MTETSQDLTGVWQLPARTGPILCKASGVLSSALPKALFWCALAAGLLWALLPIDHLMWDKAEHFLSFYTLTVLGMIAFPKRSALGIGIWLSALGAAIEIVQGTPLIHRDCEFWDWGAETIGILTALSTSWIALWRYRHIQPL